MRIIAQIDAEISYIVVVCNLYFVPYFTKRRGNTLLFLFMYICCFQFNSFFSFQFFLPTQQQLGFIGLDISCLGLVEHDLL
jgi:hypothetical protein